MRWHSTPSRWKKSDQVFAETGFEVFGSRNVAAHGIHAGDGNELFQNLDGVHRMFLALLANHPAGGRNSTNPVCGMGKAKRC